MRATDSVASFLERKSPGLLKIYVSRLADWLQALRAAFSRDSIVAIVIQHAIKTIMINLIILIVILASGHLVSGLSMTLLFSAVSVPMSLGYSSASYSWYYVCHHL